MKLHSYFFTISDSHVATQTLHVALLCVVFASAGCSKSDSSAAALPVAAVPVFSPAGGTYNVSQMVTIKDASPGVTIHYTTDGSTPTSASPNYSVPIAIASPETLEAFAAEIGYTTSAVATAAYTFTNLPAAATPSIWVAGGANSSAQTVTVTDTAAGATIYFTADGTTPTTSSSVYTRPIIVSATETIKAIAAGTAYATSSVATTAVTIAAAPWDTPTVPGQIAYAENISLADASLSGAGMINVVTAGSVDNTGSTDASCAIQAVLANSTLTHNNVQFGTTFPMQDVIVYFPNGTYLLSNPSCLPLVKNYSDGTAAYGMVFLGQSQAGVIFKLAANTAPVVQFTGNTVPGNREITNLSSTAGLRVNQLVKGPAMRSGASITAIGSNYIVLSGSPVSTATSSPIQALTPMIFAQSGLDSGVQNGNEAFNNVLENFTIDASALGNDGAVGVSFLASNKGAMRNITLLGDSDSTMQGSGIDMTRPLIGPGVVENIAISGFNWGMDVANTTTGLTVEHITFSNQVSGALRNTDNLIGANALWVKSGQGTSAITNSTPDGMITITNSRVDQTGTALVSNLAGGAVVIHNTNFNLAQTNLGGASSNVNGLLAGSTWTAGSNLFLPLTIDTPIVAYDPSSQWVAPASGMSAAWIDEVTAANTTDATTQINAALACHGTTSTLYFPHGVWYIDSPIQIPSWVDRIIGMDSTIRVLPSAKFAQGAPMFEVTSNSSGSCPSANTLVIERVDFDGSTTTASPYGIQMDAPASGIVARNVVIRDVTGNELGYGAYRVAGAGELFVEDVSISPLRVDGSNYFIARQFNSEAAANCNITYCNPRLTNNGAPAWILGFKTEGPSNVINSLMTTPPYAVNELLGAFINTAPSSDTYTAPNTTCAQAATVTSTSTQTAAAFILGAGPAVEANFIEDAVPTGTQSVATQTYPFYVNNAGTCIAGAGNETTPYTTGVIDRTPTSINLVEHGFIVPELLSKP